MHIAYMFDDSFKMFRHISEFSSSLNVLLHFDLFARVHAYNIDIGLKISNHYAGQTVRTWNLIVRNIIIMHIHGLDLSQLVSQKHDKRDSFFQTTNDTICTLCSIKYSAICCHYSLFFVCFQV